MRCRARVEGADKNTYALYNEKACGIWLANAVDISFTSIFSCCDTDSGCVIYRVTNSVTHTITKRGRHGHMRTNYCTKIIEG